MGKKFRWTEAMLCKYDMMRQAGYSHKAIAGELSITAQQVYDKTSGERKKNMSKYPKGSNKAPAEEVWRMFDEGKTRKEIADHFGVALQTICNRITAGRPKGLEPKAVQSEIVPETTESVPEIAVDVSEAANESVEEPSPVQIEDAAQVHIDEAEGVCSSDQPKPDLLMLAIRAASMASSAGFVPDHMELDSQAARDFMRVSGVGASGKVYEIELSVTDPTRLCV